MNCINLPWLRHRKQDAEYWKLCCEEACAREDALRTHLSEALVLLHSDTDKDPWEIGQWERRRAALDKAIADGEMTP